MSSTKHSSKRWRSVFAQADELGPALKRRFDGVLDRDWKFALALAFAVGVLVWFGRSIKDFFSPAVAGVMVPALVGQTESDALNESASLKLKGVVVERQPSDQFPKDVVMGQQPAAGARVREGRQISLIVSRGVNIFAMPDLRNATLRQARLTTSLPTAPRNTAARALRTRRVLAPAR